ncbi:MAG: MFS transporter, partial [Dehalococcoidia bacterium]
MAVPSADIPAGPLSGTPAAEKSPVYFGYWIVGAAFIAQFVAVGVQNYVIGVFLKPMTEDPALLWSRAEFTAARSIGQVAMAVVGLYIGSHIDRNGGRRVMVIGGLILGAALFGMSFVQELWQWLLLNGIVLTVGAAMVGNLVVNVTIAKWFVERRGRMVGLAAMGVSFAGVVLPWTMTLVVDEWGWRAGWRWLAVGATALVLPLAYFMRRAPEDYGLNPDGRTDAHMASEGGRRAAADFANSLTRREALHSPQFYLLVLAFALFTVSIGVILIQAIPFMTDSGYSRSTASLMITVTSVPALVSKPIWGIFIDRTDPKRLCSLSAPLTGSSLLLIVAAVHYGWGPLVYGGFFMLGWGWGGMIPLQEVTWASYFGRRYIGAVRSAGMPFSIGLSAIVVQLVPFYYDRVGNYDGAFLAIAGSCVVSSVLILFVRQPIPPARQPVTESAT